MIRKQTSDQFSPNNPKSPWVRWVLELVLWTKSLAVRDDCYGSYIDPIFRKDPKNIAYCQKASLTNEIIRGHFLGTSVIGLFTTNVESLCRFGVIDFDRHDSEGSQEINERAAIAVYERVVGMGFSAFLEDSDGRGSYKLWLIFEELVPARWVRRFLKSLIKDWQTQVLVREPEIFPKQDFLKPGRFGNFVRLPGRHHTLDFWSRIWDGKQWLEGEAAARQILATKGSPASIIPEEFRTDPLVANTSAPSQTHTAHSVDIPMWQIRLAVDSLPAGFLTSYDDWLKVGMSLHDLGAVGLKYWEDISRKCPRYREGACREKWGSFKADGGLTWKTILFLAMQNGWKPPRHIPFFEETGVKEEIRSTDLQTSIISVEPQQDSPSEVTSSGQETSQDREVFIDADKKMADASHGYEEDQEQKIPEPEFDPEAASRNTRVKLDEKVGDKAAKAKKHDRSTSLNRNERPDQAETSAAKPEFEYTDTGLYQMHYPKDGPCRTPLTNFGAKIIAELTVTDGDRAHKEFRIQAVVDGVTRCVDVKAEEFEPMRWPTVIFGAKAIVKAGPTNRDRTREAIQAVSKDIEQITVYQHTGFIGQGGKYYFLHAGGAIGAASGLFGAEGPPDRPTPNSKDTIELEHTGPIGPVSGRDQTPKNIEVRLPSALSEFRLPEPPTGQVLIDAIRASLKILELPTELVMYPLHALIWVGPLGIGNFTVHLDGGTGKNKSVRAGLIQQHYGARMSWEHLPCSWSSTPIALEGTAFQCKDSVLVVDDWLLQGSRSDHEQAQRSAAQMIRAVANQAGRQRSNRDGTPNAGRPPRSPLLITGEATPDGHSVNARLIRLPVDSDLLDPLVKVVLDRCQADADAGLYAQAMAGYVRYVAGRYEQLQRETTKQVAYYREELRLRCRCKHPRTATILAKLMAGFEVFLEFALFVGAITQTEFDKHYERQGDAIMELVRLQGRHLQGNDPWDQFVELVAQALLSGVAHLEERGGGHPSDDNPGAWGWRADKYMVKKEVTDRKEGTEKEAEAGASHESANKVEYEERITWKPQGSRIGWICGEQVYLLPGPTLAAAQLIANRIGIHLPLSDKTLGRTAYDRKKLVQSDIESRGKYTTRVTISGKRPEVYVMEANTILHDASLDTWTEDTDQADADKMMALLLGFPEEEIEPNDEQLEA